MENNLEIRVLELEKQLGEMKKKPTPSYYRQACKECENYFEKVRLPEQHYGMLLDCMALTRNLFKEKHKICGRDGGSPVKYVKTQEEAEELKQMFYDFANIYQWHLLPEEVKKNCTN